MSQTISRNDLEDALALFPQIILIEEDIILGSQQEVIHNHPLVATRKEPLTFSPALTLNQSLTNSFPA
jgi:hypothetical protein